jgi:hypothetical protein
VRSDDEEKASEGKRDTRHDGSYAADSQSGDLGSDEPEAREHDQQEAEFGPL